MGPGDPAGLCGLPGGAVLGVLPQRVPGVLQVAGITGRAAVLADPAAASGLPGAGMVPHVAADLTERLGGPGHDVERAGALDGLRCPLGDRGGGTRATTTPCTAHSTRGASASIPARIVPRSSARHRRRPSPWS
jgi:hypothetical protein